MSNDEIMAKAKQTWKSAQELATSLTNAAHQELAKSAPKLTAALDEQFENASRAFSDAMNDIDRKTAKEQVDLLRAYKSFLQKQTEIIDKRLNDKKTS